MSRMLQGVSFGAEPTLVPLSRLRPWRVDCQDSTMLPASRIAITSCSLIASRIAFTSGLHHYCSLHPGLHFLMLPLSQQAIGTLSSLILTIALQVVPILLKF